MSVCSYGWKVWVRFIINLSHLPLSDRYKGLLLYLIAGRLFFSLLYFLLEQRDCASKFHRTIFLISFSLKCNSLFSPSCNHSACQVYIHYQRAPTPVPTFCLSCYRSSASEPCHPLMAQFWWRKGGCRSRVRAASSWVQRLIVSILVCYSTCSFHPL